MKIVDEKGKLFGKLNIIDVLVALLLIVAVALVGLKLSGAGGVGAGGGTMLTYTVVVEGVPQAAYDNLRSYVETETGDQLMANGETLNGYVIGVTAAPHVSTALVDGGAEGEQMEILLNRQGTLDLTFTVQARVTNTTTNQVGTQEVRIGKSHILKTTHFEFEKSTVIDCKWEPVAQ